MQTQAIALASLVLLGSIGAPAQAEIRAQEIRFAKGASAASVKGRIQGDQTIDYRLRARAGQTLTVVFKPGNPSAYFNLLPPGSETALFVGSTSGHRFEGALPADGVYTIRTYLMRSAARRNEAASFALDVAIAGPAAKAGSIDPLRAVATTGRPFDATLELQRIRFRVTATNEGSINRMTIVPSGLESENRPVEREIDGVVTAAEVADLDVDGSPEIYVYVQSAGSGSYGSLVAYSANRRKSLSEISLPPVDGSAAIAKGYMGHDEFAVVENTFVRRFPLYRDGDANNRPTGGTRQLQYKLEGGEAGWRLRLDRVVEY
jgi:hypothetical protein